MRKSLFQMDLFADPQGLQEEVGEAEALSGQQDGRGWTIKVRRFQDGLWRAAPDYMGKDWGICWPLANDIQGQDSRVRAIQQAAAVLVFYLEKATPNAMHRRGLADMERLMEMAG